MDFTHPVSFPVAKRLKAAGYPQPEPGDSQFWFGTFGTLLLIREIAGTLYSCDLETGEAIDNFDKGEITGKGAFFAPTAAQIADQLPPSPPKPLTPVLNPAFAPPSTEDYIVNADELAEQWLKGREPEKED